MQFVYLPINRNWFPFYAFHIHMSLLLLPKVFDHTHVWHVTAIWVKCKPEDISTRFPSRFSMEINANPRYTNRAQNLLSPNQLLIYPSRSCPLKQSDELSLRRGMCEGMKRVKCGQRAGRGRRVVVVAVDTSNCQVTKWFPGHVSGCECLSERRQGAKRREIAFVWLSQAAQGEVRVQGENDAVTRQSELKTKITIYRLRTKLQATCSLCLSLFSYLSLPPCTLALPRGF